MPDPNYQIRPMTRDELDLAVQWAADEGWNPGLHDAECFFAADPSGFFVGLLDDEPVAAISGVRYGETFGFMGFYIVKPSHRGRGFGLPIFHAAVDFLKGRNIGLDGVVEQQHNYGKSGFELAYRNVRYQGSAILPAGTSGDPHPTLVDVSRLPREMIAAYDREFFPEERNAFLASWLGQSGHRSLGVVEDGALAGYGVIRKCQVGYKIGPLFADTPEIAKRILYGLVAPIDPEELVFLDVPEPNAAAVELAKSHDMEIVFETARMYSGGAPEIPLERLFGVTTFELG